MHSPGSLGSRDLDLCMQAPSRGPLAGKANKLLTHIQQTEREKQEGEEADKKTMLAELLPRFHRVRTNPSKLGTAH
jgi:hypothetical protein